MGYLTMNGQVKRSIKVLRRSDKEGIIPAEILNYAQGIVFMSQLKGGFLFSGTLGTGIFLKKMDNGSWSPPVSIGMSSVGVGLQIGAQKADIIIVLNDKSSVRAFTAHGQIKLGGDYMLTAGPIGRTAKAELGVSGHGFSGSFCYSMSQGIFAGISLEGAVIVGRGPDNKRYYKSKEAHMKNVLNGDIVVPREKDKLKRVKMLHFVLQNLSEGKPFDYGLERLSSRMDLGDIDNLDANDDEERQERVDDRDDDLLRKKKKADEKTQKTNSEKQKETEIAASGKNLLLGALDVQETAAKQQQQGGNAPGWGGEGTADILGLDNYSASQPSTLQKTSSSSSEYSPLLDLQTVPTVNASPTPAPAMNNPNIGIPFGAGHRIEEPISYGNPRIVVSRDHIVDEQSPDMQAHNIISAKRGDPCFLIDGSLDFGLPSPYTDYVIVQRLSDGVTGKISKYVCSLAH